MSVKWTEKVGLHATHGRFEMGNVDINYWGWRKVFVCRMVFHFVPNHWDGEDDDPRWTSWGVYFFGLEFNVKVASSFVRKLRRKPASSYRFGDAPDP